MLAGIAFALLLGGCPGAAELEIPGRFSVLANAGNGTSGTAPVAGAGGGAVAGAGGGAADCREPLPEIGCDYRTPLRNACARGGCHGSSFVVGLDLREDDLLISRLVNVPAQLSGITCSPGLTPCDPVAKTCESCSACPTGAYLVDAELPADSWIIKKLEPFVPPQTSSVPMNCGYAMPMLSTAAFSYTAEEKECLIDFFTHIASIGPPGRWPCGL